MKVLPTVCLLLITAPAAANSIVSTFDTTTEGWTVNSAATFEWRGDNGNPPGYLYIDNNETVLAYIYAPAKFLGDLGSYSGGTLSFDGNLLGTGGSAYNNTNFDYGSIRISNGALTATLDLLPGGATAPNGSWQTFTASLTAAAWGKSDSDWATLLGNVTEIRIGVEALFGNEVQGIDNIRVAAVPAPAGALLLGTGIVAVLLRLRRRGFGPVLPVRFRLGSR